MAIAASWQHKCCVQLTVSTHYPSGELRYYLAFVNLTLKRSYCTTSIHCNDRWETHIQAMTHLRTCLFKGVAGVVMRYNLHTTVANLGVSVECNALPPSVSPYSCVFLILWPLWSLHESMGHVDGKDWCKLKWTNLLGIAAWAYATRLT